MSNQFLVGDQMLTEEQMIADAQMMGISLEEYKKYYNVQSDIDAVEQTDPFLKNVKTPGPAEEAALVGPINQSQQNGVSASEDSSLGLPQTIDFTKIKLPKSNFFIDYGQRPEPVTESTTPYKTQEQFEIEQQKQYRSAFDPKFLEAEEKRAELRKEQSIAAAELQRNADIIIKQNFWRDLVDEELKDKDFSEISQNEDVINAIKDEAVAMYDRQTPPQGGYGSLALIGLGKNRLDQLDLKDEGISYYAEGITPPKTNITNAILAAIKNAETNQKLEQDLEKLELEDEFKQKKEYKVSVDTWKQGHIDSITDPNDKKIALLNFELENLKNTINNPNVSSEQKIAAQQKIKNANQQLEPLLKIKGENLKFFFNLTTNERIIPAELENQNSSDEITDYTKDLLTQIEQYTKNKKTDIDKFDTDYFYHLYEYSEYQKLKNKAYDYKPNGVSSTQQTIDLYKKGYEYFENNKGERVYKNVKVSDLIPYAEQSGVKVSPYIETTSDGQILPDLKNIIKDLKEDGPRLERERKAFETVRLLNIDPASIKKSAGTTLARGFEVLSEEVIGATATEEIFGASKVKQLDDLRSLMTDAGVGLSKEQEENFKRSTALQVTEATFAFLPELPKWAAANVISGGTLGWGRIGTYLNTLKKSKKVLDKVKYHGIMALVEEAKFKSVTGGESLLGGGAGFYLGGNLTRKIMPFRFKGNMARWNPALEKVILAGPGMAIGSEGALMVEAMVKELFNDKDFMASVKENYSDLNEAGQRLLINNFVGSLIGFTHTKARDFKSIKSKEQLVRDLEIKNEALETDLINEDISSFKKTEVSKEYLKNEELIQSLNKELEIANKDYNKANLNEIAKKRDAAQAIISDPKSTPSQIKEAQQQLQESVTLIETSRRKIEKSFEKLQRDGYVGEFSYKIQEGSEGFSDPNNKAEWTAAKAGGVPTIAIDLLKFKKGVQAHEITHQVSNEIFKRNPEVFKKLKFAINEKINETLKNSNLELGDKIKIEDAIDLVYKKQNQRPEEYIANLVELLQNPTYRRLLVEDGILNKVRKTFLNVFQKTGVKQEGIALEGNNIQTAQDLINFLGKFGKNIEAGKDISKQIEGFKNLKIDGELLTDLAGREIPNTAKAEKSMGSAEIKPETKKDVFSKANEAFEQYKNETPEARGIMVGMEFKPIVESMLKKYQDLYGMDKPTFEDIVSDVMMNTSPGYNGIPSLVKAWSPEGGASLTSYIYGNLPKRILGIIQNKYQTLGRTQRLDVEKASKLTSEEGLGVGFVDTSSPDAAVRIQRQKAETIMGFSDNVTKAGEKTAQKSLMTRIPDISADFIRSIELADGGSITFSRTGGAAKINFEGKEVEIKAKTDKDVISYINEKLAKTTGKAAKEPNYREYVQQTAKNDLFNVIAEEAGKLTNGGTTPTPEYSAFVEKSFNLYKDYISQSSINKRFAEFADPVIDSKKGKQAREKTAQGNLIFKKKNITPEEWRSYFEGDGKIRIDGRRRSLIDAIAQEIGFDRVMEQLHKEGMEKAFKERQGELGNEVAENYLAIIGKQLDRLPQGAEPPMAAKDLLGELKKDKAFASTEMPNFIRALINISNNEMPSEAIYNALTNAAIKHLNKNLTADQIKMRDSAQKEVVVTLKGLLKEQTGFEIKSENLNLIEAGSEQWLNYENNLKDNILPFIPAELISARKAAAGTVDFDLLSESFGFNRTKGKSRRRFEKLAKDNIGTKVNTEIWGEFMELYKKAPEKFVSISKDTQISEIGKLREIQASTLTPQEKQAKFNKIAPELIKNNKLVVAYHNALLKTLDAAITFEQNKNGTDRIKSVELYSPVFLNNKQYGLRVASPFTVVKTDIKSMSKKDIANEHLKESVKYKAGFASLLIEGNITPEKIAKLNSGYESVLVEELGRKAADKWEGGYGKTLPEGISPYIKLLPPEFTGNKIQKLNEYYHLPTRTTLGDYIVKNYISEQIEIAKNNYPNNTKIINALKGLQDVMLAESRKPIVEAPEAMASKDLSLELNRMIDRRYGVGTRRKISKAAAEQLGKGKGRFDVFIPPNAEDFAGMMYKLYGKGKQGNADMAFVKESLLDPFERAENAISSYRRRIGNEFKILNNEFKKINKTIDKEAVSKLDELGFTPDQAVRVWMWNKLKYDIPELNASERKKLVTAVNASPKLKSIAESIMGITQTKKAYPEPGKDWYAGNIKTDLLEFTNKEVRSKFLEPWQKNVDVIFSKENLNKMQAALGKNYVDNLTKMLKRMQTGQSRPENISKEAQAMFDYINGSVGVTMFLNARSALLQTISSVNFINWKDNNVFAAGKTLADPKKFTKTFMELMNSDFLKQRRAGLQINVEEAEIAKALEVSKNKAKTLYHKLIKFGFKPTQIADSFAIAAGGTPFYINRTKTYIKAGFSEAEAKEKAFNDFRAIAEETQQSSRQDRVSNIQTGLTGRFVFAYNNTPFQMTRLQKKAALDLANGRGDFKTNVSKILYYGAVQNAIFYSLQQALFATMFEEDETKKATDKRVERLANGMFDGFVRGTGLPGALAVTAKNTIIKYQQESERGYQADYGNVMGEALSISPPLSTKYKKGYGSFKTFKFAGTKKGKKEQEQYSPYDPLNPVNIARAKIVEATTNIPVARMLKKTDNLKTAVTGEGAQDWQRIALAFGWDKWSLGFYESLPKPKTKAEEIEMLKKMKPEDREQYLEEKAKSRSEAAAKSAATRAKNRKILDSLETSKYKPQKIKL